MQVHANMPGRKTSEIPLDNVTVLGKIRQGLGRSLPILFSQSFSSVSFCCLVVPYQQSYKQAQKGMKWRASRLCRISSLVKNKTSSETKGYKDHYATLKSRVWNSIVNVIELENGWQPFHHLKTQASFLYVDTHSIFIWLLISWKIC